MINIRKTVEIKTTDKDGQRHEYHSLEEVPAGVRAEIERLQSEGLKENLSFSSSEGPATRRISRKSASVYKIRDASGNERIYHSLDELPPEIRAAIEQARDKAKE